MFKKLFSFPSHLSPAGYRAFWIALLSFILTLSWNFAPISGEFSENFLFTLWVWRGFNVLLLLVLWLSWTDRALLASWVFLGILSLGMVASVLLNSGIGFMVGLNLLFFMVIFSILMKMGDKNIVRTTFISLTVGTAIILFDLFGPARPAIPPSVNQVLPYVLSGAIGLYFFIGYRDFQNFPLRYKLISALTLTAIIPLGINIYINITSATQNLTESANAQLTSAAVETAATIDTFIQTGLDDVRTAAQLHEWEEFLLAPAEERPGSEIEMVTYIDLRAIANRNPTYITSVGLMDIKGENLADTDFTQVGEIEADKKFFIETLNTPLPYVSAVEFDEGDLSLYFSAPVRDVNDEIIGVLRVRYDAAILQALVVETAANLELVDGQLILLDENFIRLAENDVPELILKSVVPLPSETVVQLQAEGRLPSDGPAEELFTDLPEFAEGLRNVANQPIFVAEVRPEQEDEEGDTLGEQVAVTQLETRPWLVAAAQQQAIFLAPLQEPIRANVILAVVMTVLALLAAIMVTRIISRPIRDLTKVAEEVAAGHLTAQANIGTEDEIGTLATSFNQMTQQLRELLASLEQRVADRTQALAATVAIGQNLSSLLDQQQIIQEVVDQLQKAFGYYHVHIYLMDKDQKNLKMMGGSGVVGKALFNTGHQIPAGKGLVGRAAQTNAVVLVPDVSQEPGWLPNPLLPETKAEIAAPISKGNQVLGVIDVQQNTVNGLTEVDSGLLENIATQVAVALQNAELFAQVQRSAERQIFLAQTNNKIQNAIDMGSALKVAVRELGKALNAKQTFVQLKTSDDVDVR